MLETTFVEKGARRSQDALPAELAGFYVKRTGSKVHGAVRFLFVIEPDPA